MLFLRTPCVKEGSSSLFGHQLDRCTFAFVGKEWNVWTRLRPQHPQEMTRWPSIDGDEHLKLPEAVTRHARIDITSEYFREGHRHMAGPLKSRHDTGNLAVLYSQSVVRPFL